MMISLILLTTLFQMESLARTTEQVAESDSESDINLDGPDVHILVKDLNKQIETQKAEITKLRKWEKEVHSLRLERVSLMVRKHTGCFQMVMQVGFHITEGERFCG
jgi:hypothetical protein